MFSRQRKPRTFDEMPSRFVPLSGQLRRTTPSAGDPATRPPPSHTPAMLLILALLVSLLATAAFVWRAATTPAPTAEATFDQNAAVVDALLDAARDYVQQGDLTKAEIILAQAVREHPEDQQLRIAYAETLLMSDQLDASYHQHTEALRIGPRDADLEFIAGTLAHRMGELGLAEAHFTAAQSADPNQPVYGLVLAQVQLAQGEYDKAAAALIRVRPLDPYNATIYGTLAEIYLRLNKTDVSLEQIAHARRLEPNKTVWKVIQARGLKRTGDARRALLILNSLPAADRDSRPILRNRAECYGMLSRPIDAARMYGSASDALPDDAEFALEAAIWFDRAARPDEAITYGRRAQQLGSDAAAKLVQRLADAGG